MCESHSRTSVIPSRPNVYLKSLTPLPIEGAWSYMCVVIFILGIVVPNLYTSVICMALEEVSDRKEKAAAAASASKYVSIEMLMNKYEKSMKASGGEHLANIYGRERNRPVRDCSQDSEANVGVAMQVVGGRTPLADGDELKGDEDLAIKEQGLVFGLTFGWVRRRS